VAAEIKRLNGDKSVSAVFVVGGGGTVKGYTDKLAKKLGIVKERVAIRGKEVMQAIVFENDDAIKDSLMVTPIGICLSYYAQSNNFIFVNFNGTRLKLYDNGKLTVSDAAMQLSFPNEDLFPKRGKAVNFTVNKKQRMIRGEQGDSSVITINGEPGDLYTTITSGDEINVTPSTAGADANAALGSLKELSEPLHAVVNGKTIELPRTAMVNGERQNEFYQIKDGDEIEIDNFYTVSDICKMLELETGTRILVNGTAAKMSTKVYENFTLDFDSSAPAESGEEAEEYVAEEEDRDTPQASEYENLPEDDGTDEENSESSGESEESVDSGESVDKGPVEISITANGNLVKMHGKKSYVFVDVFDYIDFDLRNPAGRSVITKVNGMEAAYMQPISEGDVLEIYWDKD